MRVGAEDERSGRGERPLLMDGDHAAGDEESAEGVGAGVGREQGRGRVCREKGGRDESRLAQRSAREDQDQRCRREEEGQEPQGEDIPEPGQEVVEGWARVEEECGKDGRRRFAGHPDREELVEKRLAYDEQGQADQQEERDDGHPGRDFAAPGDHTESNSEMVLIRCEDWMGLEM